MAEEMVRLDNLITVRQACDMSGKTKGVIHWHIRGGKLKAYRIGKAWIVDKKSLAELYDIKE